jgi:hypothetical protein
MNIANLALLCLRIQLLSPDVSIAKDIFYVLRVILSKGGDFKWRAAKSTFQGGVWERGEK